MARTAAALELLTKARSLGDDVGGDRARARARPSAAAELGAHGAATVLRLRRSGLHRPSRTSGRPRAGGPDRRGHARR